jgi:hypothetical protein
MVLKSKFYLGCIIIIVIHCVSCIRVIAPVLSETPGFYSGYNKLNDEDKKNIVFLEEDKKIPDIDIQNKVYAISAEQLQDFINHYDSCVIYFWSANCMSSYCISPVACQKFCDDNNYQFIVIAEYYTFPDMYYIMPLIRNPLFTINTKYYKTDYCNHYKRRFKKKLLKDENYIISKGNRYWIYINGKFNRSVSQLF